MGIWKWMKGTSCSPLIGRNRGASVRLPVFVLVCALSSVPLSAKPSFALRVMPAWYLPVGDSFLDTKMTGGPGGAVALDFKPFRNIGFFVDGEYVSVGLENVDPLAVTGGSFGAEFIFYPVERWSLRTDVMGGVFNVSNGSGGLSGLSVGARVLGDYQITPALSAGVLAGFKNYSGGSGTFMNAINVGVSLTLNITEALNNSSNVSVKSTAQDPVFPVFYSWYDENSLGTVKLTNTEPGTITDVRTSFYLEQYMSRAKECLLTEKLGAGDSVDVPLTAFFNETMLELTEKIEAEAKILVTYKYLGTERAAEFPVKVPVYHRNAMNWKDDKRAAAFVSSKDPAALWFSKYVSSIVTDRFRNGVNKNVQYAMGIFEGLKTYGLNYVIDPSSAYADNAAGGSIDFLQYPYQTLMYRGGDCDDLSILYCSLFEAIGINSAFITVPGHIYIAFDSGLTEEQAKKEFYAPNQFAYQDGKAWIPLEITLTKESYYKAWRTGAKEWNDANAKGTVHLYPTGDSQKIYKPVSVPGANAQFDLPDQNLTAVAFDASLDDYITREIRPQIDAYETMLARKDTSALRNRFGVLYGRYGLREDAKSQFIMSAKKDNVDGWINLGNVAFQEGNYSGALRYFNYVLSKDPAQPVALLGSARSYYELEKFRYSDALYGELCKKDKELANEYTYLASFFDAKGRAWSFSDRLATTTWSLSPEPVDPVLAAEAGQTFDEPVDAEKFLASLKETASSVPDIEAVESDYKKSSAKKTKESLDAPETSGSPVAAGTGSGGLFGMLSIVDGEDTKDEKPFDIEAILGPDRGLPPSLADAVQSESSDKQLSLLTSETIAAAIASPSTIPVVAYVAPAAKPAPVAETPAVAAASTAPAEPTEPVTPDTLTDIPSFDAIDETEPAVAVVPAAATPVAPVAVASAVATPVAPVAPVAAPVAVVHAAATPVTPVAAPVAVASAVETPVAPVAAPVAVASVTAPVAPVAAPSVEAAEPVPSGIPSFAVVDGTEPVGQTSIAPAVAKAPAAAETPVARASMPSVALATAVETGEKPVIPTESVESVTQSGNSEDIAENVDKPQEGVILSNEKPVKKSIAFIITIGATVFTAALGLGIRLRGMKGKPGKPGKGK